MLYDPRWNDQKPSLDNFIAWLESQDPKQRYDWYRPDSCACAQYARAIDWYSHWITAYRSGFPRDWPTTWNELDQLARHSRTFGGLLRKAKRLRQADRANDES